uniref:Uncharacterized protein n=1 Tax=Aegilops tauschii TaxID=37682 RepID=M8D069_AEGTA
MELSLDTLLDQEFEGRHRAERVQNSKVSYVRCMIIRNEKKFDYINRVVKRFRFRSMRRFQAALAAARRLLDEAAAVLPASSPSAPRVRVKDSRPAEEPPAKKRKASHAIPVKKMTSKERNQLYAELTKLAKLSESHVLPAHILELLKKQSRRGICDDHIEIEMHAVQDATLVEIQKQLDKFVRDRTNLSTHQHKKKMMGQEEDEDIDIVGSVSPLPVRPTPVQLVKEDEDYMDICGDTSPLKKLGEDPTISDSIGSVSDSSHQSVDSPAPTEHAANSMPPTRDLIARANEILERRRKEATSRAREKARQEVLETERMAMFNETLDEDVKALGIDQYNTARPTTCCEGWDSSARTSLTTTT